MSVSVEQLQEMKLAGYKIFSPEEWKDFRNKIDSAMKGIDQNKKIAINKVLNEVK